MNLRRTLLTLCICALTALGLVVGARPAWQAYKSWRAQSLLTESGQFEREGSLVVAFQKAHAALMLSPDAPGAGRTVARLAVLARHPDALDFWEAVVSSGAPSSEDFAAAIDAALSLRRLDRAALWGAEWGRSHPDENSLSRQRIEILMLAARGELELCRQSIARLRAARPEAMPASIVLLEARITLALDSAAGAPRAGDLFLEAGMAPTIEGVQGLVLAATFASLPAPTRLEAARRLLAHPAAKLPQHILARLTESSLGLPVDAELRILVEGLIREEDSPERAGALVALLTGGKAELLLGSLTRETAGRSRELINARLEALLIAGHAAEVLEITADSTLGALSASAGLVFRARALASLGNAESARESLGKAIELATDEDLSLLERNIRETRDMRLLLDFFERLADHARAGPLARAHAASIAYELRDEQAMDRHLAMVDPAALTGVPDLQRRILYLMTARNIRPGDTLRLSENYYAMAGATRPARLLLAFANARNGNNDTAVLLTDGISAQDVVLPEERLMLHYASGTPPPRPADEAGAGLRDFERDLIAVRFPASG